MSSSKIFYWPVVGACMTFVAVVAASLLLGGVANSAPPGGAPQTTEVLAPIATSTALAVSPVSPVAPGTRVTLTATITPSTAAGTVQFKDATTDIGAPVPVSNNGTASGSTSMLALGSHSLTAVFTPATPTAFSPSTSPAVTYVIAGAPGTANNAGMVAGTGTSASAATATNTVLTTSPTSMVTQGSPVTLTATITPSTAVGTVQFKDGATNIGAPVTVSNNGTASGSTSMLAPGSHQLTAVFTPADPVMFSPSTSSAIPLMVTGSAAGTPQTGTYQQSGLSLDIQVSILGDPDNHVVILDDCGCSSGGGVSIPVLDGRVTTLDRRPAILDGNGLLGGIVSVLLD
jgi:Big-like domain-containing protein